jgi:hypothetical protein
MTFRIALLKFLKMDIEQVAPFSRGEIAERRMAVCFVQRTTSQSRLLRRRRCDIIYFGALKDGQL